RSPAEKVRRTVGFAERLLTHVDRLDSWFQRLPAVAEAVKPFGLDPGRFRKARSKNPRHERMGDEPGILDCHRHAAEAARRREGEDVAAGLENAQHLRPGIDTKRDVAAVPLLAHEAGGGALMRAALRGC